MRKAKRFNLVLLYFFMAIFLMMPGCSDFWGSDSDNDDKGNASGLWDYHSETDMNAITLEWRDVDFPCNGPILGNETVKVTITETTMTWEDDVIRWLGESGADGAILITWTRESGAAGDPVGTWTATGEDGSTYELELGEDGVVFLSADNISCSSDE
ncbi:MAG: hypothetical protein JW925_04680 [Syntrophaceae bacterium]|nr:hypothetical protein [Syntrophaceae bacterium]